MINLDESICTDPDAAPKREWLETNGLGGFASATITGQNTRRYHGLLVAARRPPTERVMLLSKLEETLIINGEATELGANQYPNNTHPRGFRHLVNFRLDPFPVFTFRVGEVELEKTVFMLRWENTTVVRYRLNAPPDTTAKLVLRPLVAFRDYHALQRETAAPFVDIEESLVRVAPSLWSLGTVSTPRVARRIRVNNAPDQRMTHHVFLGELAHRDRSKSTFR